MAAVLPLQPTDSFAGTIATAGEVDSFQVMIPNSGRLTAGVQTGTGISLQTRLSLLDDPNGRLLDPNRDLLIQSDGQSATNPGDQITQDVLAGTYVVEVTGLGSGTGAYTLTTQFQQATPPDQPLGVAFNHAAPWTLSPASAVTGDFRGDGHLDMVTLDTATNSVSVLLGLGDGTFQSALHFATGAGPTGIVAGDFDGRHYANGKPILDLAVANSSSNDISILLGNGDGTFQPQKRFAAGTNVLGMTAADLRGDGRLDLVLVDRSNEVSILLGNGDGTFQPEKRYAVGDYPGYVAVGDFDGDGHLDLAVSNFASNDISILLGNGDGTFQPQTRVATGTNPLAIVTGDFNGDGHLDLATANSGSNDVSVLLGNGNGTFQSQVRYLAGTTPFGLATGDFTGQKDAHGNPILDLAVANQHTDDVSVLLGRGDGTFQDQVRYEAGFQPWVVLTGDFNGDGHLDLATANARSHDVSILLGLGNGTFQPDLANPRPGATNPLGIVVGDFNHDGIPDLATVDYTGGDLFLFLGRGDGTFQERQRLATAATSVALISADVNGDGIPDLITANCFSSDVSILLANGDGTFQPAQTYPASHFCQWVVAGDFDGRLDHNGKPILDLVTGGDLDNDLSILRGRGDGTFEAPVPFGSTSTRGPAAVVGDFDGRLDANGQPILDLAIANTGANAVLLFLGRGDGTFQDPVNIPVGSRPVGLVTGDFGNGHLDLAVTDSGSNDVSVLLGRGDGTFAPAVRYPVGVAPDSIIAGDFTGDGHLALAVTNGGSTYISLLLGRGDGTFAPQVQSAVTDTPTIHHGLAVGDFDRDGHLDLATAQLGTSDISVLLGKGDGTFQPPLRFAVGLGPVAAVSGDFSNSGRRDVASVNPNTNEVAVALGAGDGTLGSPVFYPVGNNPVAIVTGDFNGDGRFDLAIANFASNDVSVLLGLGDGTFRPEQRYPVGTNPTGIVAGDFDGDGHLDLAVINAGSNDISLLFGQGDGTFANEVRLAAPDLPQALVVGDFSGRHYANGNPILDLATANYRSQDVTVFVGRGDGTFEAPVSYALGTAPVALLAADLTGDGHLDLVTANFRSGDVSVLLGRGDGTFQAPVRYEAGDNPVAVVAGVFNRDGHLDLATADSTANAVALLVGRGDGTFGPPVQYPVAAYPRALIADDFNNDGRTDLAVASQFSRDVSIMMGLGNGKFLSPDTISNEIHATPLVADLNGDGTPDVAVLNHAGQILLRYGRPDAPGTFEPPLVVNPDPDPPARELALVRTGSGVELAALDAGDSGLSFYSRGADGKFTRTAVPVVPGVGALPVRLAAGDLNGDGRDDLVVAATGSNQVFVYLQNADGSFGLQPADGSPWPSPNYQVGVGVNPSAITLTDVDGDGRLDIVVTNQFSGDVSVLLNDPSKPFGSELRFRAGVGLYWVDQRDGSPVIHSFQGSAGVVSGLFDGKTPDLVVTNSGANSFSLLQGTGLGGFLNPQTARTFSTGVRPTGVVAGDFNHDGNLDLAILNEGSQDISIFLGDGHGGFTEKTVTGPDGQPMRLSAGNAPTGLTLADVNGDGIPDLLVGNAFGDVLVLLGNGDGTFQPYRRTDGKIALAVADLTGNGQPDFIFADPGLDRVTVQYPQPGQSFSQDRSDGLLAPGAVAVADLNGDGIPDLIVANSGGNNVLVYLGLGNGQFGPAHSFFVGTNPAGITVAFLNSDGIPDLVVANEGSNDVSILLGHGQGPNWTLVPGPRLRLFDPATGKSGAGPVSTTVADVTGTGIPDILVANSQSNDVWLIPGIPSHATGTGTGFFNDQHPLVFDTGLDPQQALVGDFTGDGRLDLVSINAGSNDLTFFRDFGQGGISIATGGETPVAALAGDFSGDGRLDLLVANNGDGLVTLLAGGADGPHLTATLARADVPHPTDLAVVASGAERDVYVTEEGQESALLLTSFGVAVPVLVFPEAPLTGVFVVNGPGLEQGIDIAAQPAASAALPSAPLPSAPLPNAENLARQSPAEGRGDPGLAAGATVQAAPAAVAVVPGQGGTITVATASSGGGEDGNPPGDDTPAAEAPPSGFRMGLDEAFRRRWSQEPADGLSCGPAIPADLLAAVDGVFAAWQSSAAGLASSNDSDEPTGTAGQRAPGARPEWPLDEGDAGLPDAAARAASSPDALLGSPPGCEDAVWVAGFTAARDALPEVEVAQAAAALAAAALFLAGAYPGDARGNRADAPDSPCLGDHGRSNEKK
jgi:hypothetical protein